MYESYACVIFDALQLCCIASLARRVVRLSSVCRLSLMYCCQTVQDRALVAIDYLQKVIYWLLNDT